MTRKKTRTPDEIRKDLFKTEDLIGTTKKQLERLEWELAEAEAVAFLAIVINEYKGEIVPVSRESSLTVKFYDGIGALESYFQVLFSDDSDGDIHIPPEKVNTGVVLVDYDTHSHWSPLLNIGDECENCGVHLAVFEKRTEARKWIAEKKKAIR